MFLIYISSVKAEFVMRWLVKLIQSAVLWLVTNNEIWLYILLRSIPFNSYWTLITTAVASRFRTSPLFTCYWIITLVAKSRTKNFEPTKCNSYWFLRMKCNSYWFLRMKCNSYWFLGMKSFKRKKSGLSLRKKIPFHKQRQIFQKAIKTLTAYLG